MKLIPSVRTLQKALILVLAMIGVGLLVKKTVPNSALSLAQPILKASVADVVEEQSIFNINSVNEVIVAELQKLPDTLETDMDAIFIFPDSVRKSSQDIKHFEVYSSSNVMSFLPLQSGVRSNIEMQSNNVNIKLQLRQLGVGYTTIVYLIEPEKIDFQKTYVALKKLYKEEKIRRINFSLLRYRVQNKARL